MTKYIVAIDCYDKMLVNVTAYIIRCVFVCVCVVRSKQEPVYNEKCIIQYAVYKYTSKNITVNLMTILSANVVQCLTLILLTWRIW